MSVSKKIGSRASLSAPKGNTEQIGVLLFYFRAVDWVPKGMCLQGYRGLKVPDGIRIPHSLLRRGIPNHGVPLFLFLQSKSWKLKSSIMSTFSKARVAAVIIMGIPKTLKKESSATMRGVPQPPGVKDLGN
jgi:hypothetical protein